MPLYEKVCMQYTNGDNDYVALLNTIWN